MLKTHHNVMKKIFTLITLVALCLTFSGCRVSFPAQSEEAYQQSVTAIKKELNKSGYNLVKVQSLTGNPDYDNYTFTNSNNDIVEFTLAVDRDSDQKTKFIKSVDFRGCSVSKQSEYDSICGYNGVIATTLREETRNDIKGTKASVGATIFGIIVADFLLGLAAYLILKSQNSL